MDIVGVVFLLALLIPVWLALREMREMARPERLRELGIVVLSTRAFDEVSEVIGHYMGCDIYRCVTFHGMRYIFDGVGPPGLKRALRARQLFLEPGLVYVLA